MTNHFDESKALHDAARTCGFDGHTEELRYRKDATTHADRIAVSYKTPVVVKRSYLYLDSLDTTFFYNRAGNPTCAFVGIVCKPSSDYEHMAEMSKRITDMLDAMEIARDAKVVDDDQ